MKYNILIAVAACFFWQCSDFLEEASQTEIRPSTVSDMRRILENDAYPTVSDVVLFNRETEIFTDNYVPTEVLEPSQERTQAQDAYRFRWQSDMFNEGGGGNDMSFFNRPYDRIKGCHIIMEYTGEMDGDDAEKNYLIGEAYALRGYYYYYLVNFFGWPYSYGDPYVNPGVPLKLNSGVTGELFRRASVGECYEQIVKDLKEGIRLMEQSAEAQPTDFRRLKPISAKALLARVYLHMQEYDSVLVYANEVLEERPELYDMSVSSSQSTEYGVYGDNTPVEMLWGCTEDVDDNAQSVPEPYLPGGSDLELLYSRDIKGEATDVRFSTQYAGWLYRDTWGTYPGILLVIKGRGAANWTNGGIRTGEVYVTRAEVYARKYVETQDQTMGQAALDDLNFLRRHRFSTGLEDYVLTDFASPQDLLDFCLRERRRELLQESSHRWFDLRRLGMPRIEHQDLDHSSGLYTTYYLQEKDPRYVLPIPEKVLERNPELRDDNY